MTILSGMKERAVVCCRKRYAILSQGAKGWATRRLEGNKGACSRNRTQIPFGNDKQKQEGATRNLEGNKCKCNRNRNADSLLE